MSGRKFGGGAGGSKAASNLQYTKNEPSFLKRLKAQVGYKDDSANLSDKIPDPQAGLEDEDARDDTEDERPTVVVLNEGDLTAEEANALARGQDFHSDVPPPDGRVLFRRPKKRTSSKVDEESRETARKPKRQSKKVKSSLLSFGEDDDDDDDGDEEEEEKDDD